MHRMTFGQVSDLRANFGQKVLTVVIENRAAAPGGCEQAEDHAQAGSFARTISAKKSEDRSARHGEVQIVNHALGTEVAREMMRLNRIVAHRLLRIQFFAC